MGSQDIKTDTMSWTVEMQVAASSTQDKLKDLMNKGKDFEGLVVQALTQDSGRGRHGREWHSPRGNVYMSVLLKPDCGIGRIGELSFVIALAVSSGIDNLLPDTQMDKVLKWPNDVWINGKKCAGLLLETDLDQAGNLLSVRVGIGVNVMTPPDDAIGLAALGDDITIHNVRHAILHNLDRYYTQWQKDGFAPIRMAWLSQAHKLGEVIEVKQRDKTVSGVFDDIDVAGQMVLKTDTDQIVINTGDVFF